MNQAKQRIGHPVFPFKLYNFHWSRRCRPVGKTSNIQNSTGSIERKISTHNPSLVRQSNEQRSIASIDVFDVVVEIISPKRCLGPNAVVESKHSVLIARFRFVKISVQHIVHCCKRIVIAKRQSAHGRPTLKSSKVGIGSTSNIHALFCSSINFAVVYLNFIYQHKGAIVPNFISVFNF